MTITVNQTRALRTDNTYRPLPSEHSTPYLVFDEDDNEVYWGPCRYVARLMMNLFNGTAY